ncbi:MAG: DUF4870 domain-containing protein [Planctomycetota bacterium]|nr:DUF4870 domain-containing protein [Planctomycetota bacterium]
MTNEFNEDEWRASAKDSPSFHFEKGETKRKPDFEPDPGPEEEADARAREWRAAEPPPRRKPYRDGGHGAANNRNQPRNPSHAESGSYAARARPESYTWAMLSHAAGAVAILFSGGILGWATPLAIWLLHKDDDDFASSQAKEALNFQITMIIFSLIAALLCLILIGFPMIFVLVLVNVIWSIQGAVATYNGRPYQYPWNMRIL